MILVKSLTYMWILSAFAFSTFMLITHGCDSTVNYGELTECDGKIGTNFIMHTLEDVTRVDCAISCEAMYQCMAFFHNLRTRSCSLHNRTLTDIEMLPDVSSRCFVADDVVESWVVEIVSVSSSYPEYPAHQMIGPPDEHAWAQERPDQNEFLEVRFSGEMYMEQIHIYETEGYGVLSGISLLTPEGTWYPVWSTEELEPDYIYYWTETWTRSEDLTITDFKTASIHIDIQNNTFWWYYEVIDAIRVCGKGRRFSERNYVL